MSGRTDGTLTSAARYIPRETSPFAKTDPQRRTYVRAAGLARDNAARAMSPLGGKRTCRLQPPSWGNLTIKFTRGKAALRRLDL